MREHKMTNVKEKKFCFTGALESMTRKEAHDLLSQHGGIPKTSIVKDLDFLVSNAKEETVKIRKAKEQGTKIITEAEFLDMFK
jgi:DNA ligase (NAD+)